MLDNEYFIHLPFVLTTIVGISKEIKIQLFLNSCYCYFLPDGITSISVFCLIVRATLNLEVFE
jgi:hypothetical protein